MYVVGRWSALQLSGYCHKALCLITNKRWFNQGPEYCWIDRLQLSSSLWGVWVCNNGSCVCISVCVFTCERAEIYV